MIDNSDAHKYELICLVVKHGLGSRVIKIAKHNGISGATVFYGRGTIKNQILEFLELNDVRKEIILMLAEKRLAYQALEVLDKELQLHKPNHGIAYTFSVRELFGVRGMETHNVRDNVEESECDKGTMYKAVFVVVDKGNGEAVVEAAREGGSRGATIINARGSGIHETSMLFGMAIEPEKEIVMILVEESVTDSVVSSVRDKMSIDEPGKGIMFIIDVKKAYGLYQHQK